MVYQFLDRTFLFHRRLENALVKGQQGNEAAAVPHGFGCLGHHFTIYHVDVPVKAESPYAGVVHRPGRAVKSRDNSNPGMLRSRIHALVHKHVVEGIGILISLHQAGEAEAHRPDVVPGLSQAPAKLCTVPLAHNAAFAGFPAAGAVHVPFVSLALEGHAVFRNGEFPYGHGTQVAYGNVEFCSGRAGLRGPHLGNPGRSVLFQLHPDVHIPDITDCLPPSHKTGKGQANKNKKLLH